MRGSSFRRPLCVVLALAIVQQGCASTEVGEHRTHGAPEAVVVRPTWTDGGGVEHLVGGITCTLHGPGGVNVSGTTDGRNPLVFQNLTPGGYELVLAASGIEAVHERLELRPRRWANVRVRVTATEKAEPQPRTNQPAGRGDDGGSSSATSEQIGDGVVFFFKAVGTVLLCVTLVGLILVVLAVDSSPPEHCDCDQVQPYDHDHAPSSPNVGRPVGRARERARD